MPSTVIHAFDYEPAARRLAITFTTGRRYAYRDVPADIVRRLRAAASKGRYFNARIRGRFAFEPLPAIPRRRADEAERAPPAVGARAGR